MPIRSAAAKKKNIKPIDRAGSFGEWLKYLGADVVDPGWMPMWPPDAFAITAAFLRRTGAYIGLVNGEQGKANTEIVKPDRSKQLGERWRNALNASLRNGKDTTPLRRSCPSEIRRWWKHMQQCAAMPLAECGADLELVAAICNLCIVSDAASAGIGIRTDIDPFLGLAESILERNGRQSFCFLVPVEKLTVLGKQHTPQRGCTIRSLTHNLALCTPSEINARWFGPYKGTQDALDVFNLLLLPWPTKVDAADFTQYRSQKAQHTGDHSNKHRYFDYSPTDHETPAQLAKKVATALDKASLHTNRIHAVVLPELALSEKQFLAIEKVVIQRGAILIAGLQLAASSSTSDMPVNACTIQTLGMTVAATGKLPERSIDQLRANFRPLQAKHHRWCLDRNQILQYELGGKLPASHDCWERTHIGTRDINFFTIGSWLTMCALICEDLARQEPVAEVIRSIGPNIVFALLMDGPQLRNRWSSRYASVLAEDPGCSVLSMTSLGMAKRSRPSGEQKNALDCSSTIALWRDSVFGEREISLEPGDDACVLSLVCKSQREFTMDGRDDNEQAHFPVFAGAFSFKVAK